MKISSVLILMLVIHSCPAQQTDNNSKINFIATDIDAFWKAFDLFKKDTASNPFIQYLTQGSPALHALRGYQENDTTFKKTIKQEIVYYENIRSSSYRMMEYKNQTLEYFKAFKELYPPASFPDVYFVIGKTHSGGTSFHSGVIIGMEMFSDSTVKTSYGHSTMPLESLPEIIASTMIYFNQKPAHTGYTLLRQCVVQGSADFISTLLHSKTKTNILNQGSYRYGDAHEEALVKEFLRRKNGDDFSGWLYGFNSDENRPTNLGSWIGYKITEAYYNNASNKKKAIDEILKINDFEKFLLLSGYVEPFRN